jgi:hypothetical protein
MRVWRTIYRTLAASAWLCVAGAVARAEAPATRPALEELNREVHALYGEAQAGLVRVQLPRPQWLDKYTQEPLNKYQQVDPAMMQRLLQQMQNNLLNQGAQNQGAPNQGAQNQLNQNQAGQNQAGQYQGAQDPHVYSNAQPYQAQNDANISPANATQSQAPSTQPGTIIVVSPPAQQQAISPNAPGGPLQMNPAHQPDFSPTHVGLVLDDQGRVLVPIYIERETCTTQPVRVAQPDGQIAEAMFIGSDRQTNVTIVQCAGTPAAGPGSKPIPLGDRIDPGSVCLFVSPSNGAARLGVWTGGDRDWGYVLATDGHVAGVARAGHILSGSACKLIAGEIEQYGVVRRPTLGVVVGESVMIDAARNQRQVMLVQAVLPGSAAEKAGLQPGDILQTFRGEPVSDVSSLAAAMAACDGKTELQVLRNNQSLKLAAELTLPVPGASQQQKAAEPGHK